MNARTCLLLVAIVWTGTPGVADAQCLYSVTPTSISTGSTAFSRTLSVSTGTQCSWTAVSNVSWMQITSGATGTGFGSVVVAIAENSTGSSRTGTLLVAGITVTVTQSTTGCTYSVTPTSFSLGSGSVQRTISVSAGTLCTWTAVPNVAWITITSGASDSGFGSVVFVAAANPTAAARTGGIAIGDKLVTVTQAAGTGTSTPPAAPTGLRIVQ